MKYKCQQCRFQWEGNTDTFFKVLEHEKIHKEKQQKLETNQKNEKTRISSRRKSQLKGKTINKQITHKKKSSPNRRVAKRRSSIR